MSQQIENNNIKASRVLTYVLSWRTKLEKLLCLKYLGRRLVANLCESQTMKLLRAWLHETIKSVAGSSTMSNVFVRNGGGPASCSPSIGCGERVGDEQLPPMSSTFTFTPSMAFLLRIASFFFLSFLPSFFQKEPVSMGSETWVK
eukprot:TRINITY_DN12432_c0_g2_i1.p1 TRINITY_DN12432_c0_g2~~TRINITY_DN12432_c0_g2_i1.p1  ORF type:complete len:145 (+),score=20.11 TRINITY_DN12432_c0_g2_i1:463-897(+)